MGVYSNKTILPLCIIFLFFLIVPFGSSFQKQTETFVDKTSNLTAYWNFDEGEGFSAADQSGNGNIATLLGGTSWAPGRINTGLYFDGNDDYAKAQDSNSLDIGTTDFTIMAWVNVSQDFGVTGAIVSKTLLEYNTGYFFGISGVNQLYFEFGQEPGGWTNYVYGPSTFAVPRNSWHHLAITFTRAGNATFYLDGVRYNSIDISSKPGSIANDRPLWIGMSETFPNQFMGSIDEVKIFTKALSDTEIFQEANPSGFPVTGCMNITSPGMYALQNDIILAQPSCITFQASNATLDCQGHSIQGNPSYPQVTLIATNLQNDIVIKNCILSGAWSGIHVTGNESRIFNNTIFNMSYTGIHLGDSSNVQVSFNIVENNTIHDVQGSTGTISGILLNSINLEYLTNNNTIRGNYLFNNRYGAVLTARVRGNYVYNNYFSNNTVKNANTVSSNYWNTTKTPGTNIVGGPYIAGNYWHDYYGDDLNEDGIGDNQLPYDNKDYAPLTINHLTSCKQISQPGSYTVRAGISSPGTCFTILTDNVSIDCRTNQLTGSATGAGFNITKRNNVEARNCTVRNYYYGVLLDNTNNSAIRSNYLFTNSFGIESVFSKYNLIQNNYFDSNNQGISLYSSSNSNTISANTFLSHLYGIEVFTSSGNTVQDNYFSNNNYGVFMSAGTGNIFRRNMVNGNGASYGVYLTLSQNNNITENNISANSKGLWLRSTSTGNSINTNRIYTNSVGSQIDSSSNFIYNNYFSNTVNAQSAYLNVWNTSRIPGKNIRGGPYLAGNLWHNYNGLDLDLDGIGDTNLPYTSGGAISPGGDYAPLVNIPPTLQPIDPISTSEGLVIHLQLQGSDVENDPLTYSRNDTMHGTFFDPATGYFEWFTEYRDAGNYTILFTVSDGSRTDNESVHITINDATPPRTGSSPLIMKETVMPAMID
ncbi:MAG: NosD domain-containing protein [Nanoarchaeota archaeon]